MGGDTARRLLDGGTGWVHSRAVPLFDEGNVLREWFGAATDVTARKRGEQHQAVLMAELDHRVKNILAVVQAIAQQSLGRENVEAATRLIGRINALAQSHTLLASSRWEGVVFGDLIESAIAPYRGEQADRIIMTGPDVKVTPRAALTLTLALHELVTNAAKYGALSRAEGGVSAEWRLTADAGRRRLFFTWQEHGGPTLEGPPSRKGFGSRLIEKTLASDLSGDVTLDFAPGGGAGRHRPAARQAERRGRPACLSPPRRRSAPRHGHGDVERQAGSTRRGWTTRTM